MYWSCDNHYPDGKPVLNLHGQDVTGHRWEIQQDMLAELGQTEMDRALAANCIVQHSAGKA
jgi:hypothetical protein